MKRKITFLLTVGSHWEHPNRIPEHMWEVEFPQGGDPSYKTIEFETDGIKPFDDATKALEKHMKAEGTNAYHIWYWDWLSA